MQPLDPVLLKSLILLLPLVATGIAFMIGRPGYYQSVGLMLGFLLNIPYLFLVNILAEHMGWWVYQESSNAWYGIPVEIILGWSIFWGVFLPWVFRFVPVYLSVGMAMFFDLLLMPQMTGLFTLGGAWLVGEVVCLVVVLLPSMVVFQLTAHRKFVVIRALIQSLIWGGWIVFLLPAVALQVEGIDIFAFFHMHPVRIALFLSGLAVSMFIGYLALFEFAIRGGGTPIPFDPPKKLVVTGIYSVVANPLQVSTLLMMVCILIAYKSYLMLLPIIMLILYSEIFVRWHHSVDIKKRFGAEWTEYRSSVNHWIPSLYHK